MANAPPFAVDPDALRRHCPLVAYVLAEHFLAAQRLACERLALDPTQFTIYATIVSGNSQRAMRDAGAFQEDGLPPLVPVSRRAIAAATGLARETVRRQVQHLVENGFAEAVDGGVVVRLTSESLAGIQETTEGALTSFVRAANMLLRFEVIEPRSPAAPRRILVTQPPL